MINKTIMQGRLTANPELKKTGSDISFCNFTVAWSEKRGENESKCFLRCTAWRGTAEFLSKYFKKGQELIVEGSLQTREWTDNEGNTRSVMELIASSVNFCGSKKQNDEDFEEVAEADEDLPF